MSERDYSKFPFWKNRYYHVHDYNGNEDPGIVIDTKENTIGNVVAALKEGLYTTLYEPSDAYFRFNVLSHNFLDSNQDNLWKITVEIPHTFTGNMEQNEFYLYPIQIF